MKAIETKGLTKDFSGRVAVDALDMTVEQGECFALLGLNGAGKTTTIRMLCCQLEPTSGDALILGDSIRTAQNAVKQKLNVSPQETAVARQLTVRENLEMIAGIYGEPRDTAKKKAQEMLEKFNLTDRAKDKAKTLSGGMQRKLSIAMALISDPKIIFLDEPTLGLDVRARRELWKDLEELRGKVTIVLTTHYLEEAEALAERIAVMEQGHIKATGTADELKQLTGKETLEDAFLALTDGEVEA